MSWISVEEWESLVRAIYTITLPNFKEILKEILTISDVTLVTPPSSLAPLQAALRQNPHLTSLPTPSVIAPKELEMTTGTAELLRLPEVQNCIKSDFLLLPCDLVCDLPGESLLEAWMVSGGEKGRRNGLSMYYQTQGREESVKGETTDFVAVAPLEKSEAPTVSLSELRAQLSKLVLSMPMSSLKERMEHDKGFLMRHTLVDKHPQVKLLTSFRDAHIYILPYWVKDMARLNEHFQSVSEDLIGWWAKSEWQRGLSDKLQINSIFERKSRSQSTDEDVSRDDESFDGEGALEEEINLPGMSTTKATSAPKSQSEKSAEPSHLPPMLAYVQRGKSPFVRRVDTSALLLSTSLRLAKLESIEEVGRIAASSFAHNAKIAYPQGIAQRCTVTKNDCLLDINTTVEEKCVIKESCIGANVQIASGARLTRCLIMDGAVIGSRAQLTGCIVGRRSKIGRESVLKDCEVQDGNVVPDETDAKNEKFMVFEGLDDDDDDMDGSDGSDL
jgi:translation initiation factor eIF-2B subunit gamma